MNGRHIPPNIAQFFSSAGVEHPFSLNVHDFHVRKSAEYKIPVETQLEPRRIQICFSYIYLSK